MRFFSISRVVLVLTLLLSVATTFAVHTSTQKGQALRFENAVQGAQDRIAAQLETYVAVLRSTTAFFTASDFVSNAEFHTYVQRLNLEQRYSGIQGIGFSLRVAEGREDSVMAAQRAAGQTGFRLWPEESEVERHAIVFLEPQDARNREAMGYNMYAEPIRREAMQRARDTGQAALSGKVKLVQEIGPDRQRGFLIYLPFYRGGAPPPTEGERRAALEGFVYAPFRADDVLASVFTTREAPRAAFRIYDGPITAPEALLHDSRRVGIVPVARPRYTAERQIEVAGRVWTVVFSETPLFRSVTVHGVEWYIGLLCVGLSLLVFVFIREQERAAVRARDAEQRLRALLERMPVGVLVADASGCVDFANTAARRLWAFEPLPAEADDIREVATWTAPLREAAPDPLGIERALRGRPAEDELLALHADGTERTLLRATLPMQGGPSNEPQAMVVVVDLSAQREAQEAEARALREHDAREAAEAREVEMRRVADALQRSNRELQEFAYIASHDLQEPLRRISAFIDLIRLDYTEKLDEQGRHYLDRIQHGALRLSHLIRDLLVFSRLTTRRRTLSPVPLAPLFERLVAALETPLREAGGTVDIGELPTIVADAPQMRQMFEQLLANAVKFHRDGAAPRIEIRGGAAEGPEGMPGWRIEVRDNGIGFEPRYAERIFTPFQRLHPQGTYEGTGIGLAICRRIVENHHGTIDVESVPGDGCTFRVWLPQHPESHPVLPKA